MLLFSYARKVVLRYELEGEILDRAGFQSFPRKHTLNYLRGRGYLKGGL